MMTKLLQLKAAADCHLHFCFHLQKQQITVNGNQKIWSSVSSDIFLELVLNGTQHNTNTEHTHYRTNYQTTNYKIKALQIIKVKLSQMAKRQAPNL